MEMPRRCSSSRRSVSVPVMYRTSVVLPWSTCPAVPMVSAIGRSSKGRLYGAQDRLLIPFEEGPNIEPQPSFAHAAHHGRVRRTQLPGQSSVSAEAHSVGWYLVERERAATAAGDRGCHVHGEARRDSGELAGQPIGAGFDVLRRSVEHLEGRELLRGGSFEVGGQGGFQSGEAKLIGAQGADQRVAAHRRDPTRLPDGDPGLRSPEELVPGEDGQGRSIPDRRLRFGLVAYR